MKNENYTRLWRVEIRSRYGYDAPYQIVEAKKSEVHSIVQNLNLRLLDFPKIWSYHLIDLKKEYDSKRGKWFPAKEEF